MLLTSRFLQIVWPGIQNFYLWFLFIYVFCLSEHCPDPPIRFLRVFSLSNHNVLSFDSGYASIDCCWIFNPWVLQLRRGLGFRYRLKIDFLGQTLAALCAKNEILYLFIFRYQLFHFICKLTLFGFHSLLFLSQRAMLALHLINFTFNSFQYLCFPIN